MEFVITWRELLIAILLATAVYLLEVLVFSRRRRPVPPPVATIDTASTDRELARLREEVTALRRRLDALETLVNRPPPAEPVPDDSPYGQAVRLARQGLAPQELAARCGISRGEAELIVALNRGEP
ncbi:MAG: DUF2802 domain-containing protein [Thiobacillaceae bacterium]|jgi:hypothetical protein|nr:DUF2802 domain-containing protein [Thiobacillaceae bacterium]